MQSPRNRASLFMWFVIMGVLVAPVSASAHWATWLTTRSVASASSEYAWESAPYIDKQGSWVVIARNTKSDGSDDVVAYDPRRGSLTTCSTTLDGYQSKPRVSGDWVVYEDSRHGNYEIYAYSLETGSERRITLRTGNQGNPAVSGNRIAYVDLYDNSVRLFDLSTGTDTPIATGVENVRPAISDLYVAYVKAGVLRVRDLGSGADTAISSTAVGNYRDLDIDGARLVWAQLVGAHYDVFFRDLSSPTNTTVASEAQAEWHPSISGTRIVYSVGAGQDRLVLYDTELGRTIELEDDAAVAKMGSLSGNTLAWEWYASSPDHGINVSRLAGTSLTMSAPNSIAYGATFSATGLLADNGLPMAGKTVRLDRSTDGGRSWTEIGSTLTSADGEYSMKTLSGLTTAAVFRARFSGTTRNLGFAIDTLSALSPATIVKPRVYLGRPSGPKSIHEDRYFTVRGALKPQHTSGTAPARIQVFKKSGSHYVLKKTYTASVYDYDTYSRYKARIRLTSRGKWRIRAYYPTSPTNFEKHSSYRYITAY